VNEDAQPNWGMLCEKQTKNFLFAFHYRQDAEMEEIGDVVSE
jgi:hypothetical protein